MKNDLGMGLSVRGNREMHFLLRLLLVALSGVLLIGLSFPWMGFMLLGLTGVLVSMPFLLYALDKLEQKHPWLEPYFNPFDRKPRRDSSDDGQISIIGILAAFLTIAVYFSLIPAINSVIDANIGSLGPVEQTLVGLIHLVFIVTIIGSIVIYSQRE